MYIRPATKGALVPDPAMQGTPAYYLPTEGREVEDSDYWVRRVRDGDVLVGQADEPSSDTAHTGIQPESTDQEAP